jgi:hypothetical protein
VTALKDIGVVLANEPGALARFGQTLGRAGVSLEGGGVFTHEGVAIAHFLVDEAETARAALEAAGIGPVTINPVVLLQLDQEVPGQLGAFAHSLAQGGVNILVQYSDHNHSLVIVTDAAQHGGAEFIAREWTNQRLL